MGLCLYHIAILKDSMIFLNEFFFQTILVEFNEKLHDI